MSRNRVHIFDNGLILLAEEMAWSESVSFQFRIPLGAARDPENESGLANLLCEMTLRGAGDLDNREFLQTLENLGVVSSESVHSGSTLYSASLVADKFERTLELYADLLRRPRFPREDLEMAKQSVLQEIQGIEDEPSRKMERELCRIFYPAPWGNPTLGEPEDLLSIGWEKINAWHQQFFQPKGTILSVAGRFDWENLKKKIDSLFGDWAPCELPAILESDQHRYYSHLDLDSVQTQIGLAWPTVPIPDPNYLYSASGVCVLSGGMSSRLFTEVREKRGLCYSVSASTHTLENRAAISCFCGTRAVRAQESLDVILSEVDRLYREGIQEEELERLKLQNKFSLVVQQESTLRRACSIAADWYYHKRIRSMEELEARVEALTCEDINRYLAEHPAGPFRLVSIGPEKLNFDESRLG